MWVHNFFLWVPKNNEATDQNRDSFEWMGLDLEYELDINPEDILKLDSVLLKGANYAYFDPPAIIK